MSVMASYRIYRCLRGFVSYLNLNTHKSFINLAFNILDAMLPDLGYSKCFAFIFKWCLTHIRLVFCVDLYLNILPLGLRLYVDFIIPPYFISLNHTIAECRAVKASRGVPNEICVLTLALCLQYSNQTDKSIFIISSNISLNFSHIGWSNRHEVW